MSSNHFPASTLFEAIGGAEGVLRLAHAWHECVLADEVVAHAFSHGFHPQHTERLAAYWGEAWGGPPAYSKLYGSESSVVRMHSGNGHHEEMDRRAIECFDKAMDLIGLTHLQLRRALHDYFAWATTTTMAAYPEDADHVPDDLSIPRWSWDGLQPMTHNDKPFDVVLEVGKTRVFAIARGWPGWCRGGSDEAAALAALLDCAPKYQEALQAAQVPFTAPKDLLELVVVERLKGDSTTDFGAPGIAWQEDTRPVSQPELEFFQKILEAGWSTFDQAVKAAEGKSLRKGPRGGGRDLEKIIGHLCEVDIAYLKSLGASPEPWEHVDLSRSLAQVRQQIRVALVAKVRGELPERGPRGGLRWTPRYFVRRVAWHVFEHAWEIESRVEG